MPKRSRTDETDEITAAFDTLQQIIRTTEGDDSDPAVRVQQLQRLAWEILQFAEAFRMPKRVIDALTAAARGTALPTESLLPIALSEIAYLDDPAVTLGRAGGLKGGAARAAALSPRKRKEIARKAAAARWRK